MRVCESHARCMSAVVLVYFLIKSLILAVQFSSVQKRQDYPAVSETLQEQVTKLVNVMGGIAGIDGFSDVS